MNMKHRDWVDPKTLIGLNPAACIAARRQKASFVMKFNKIETTDFYGAFESIKGRKAVPKFVWVKWPNGSVGKCSVKIVEGHGSAQVDMNNCPDHFATRRLLAVTEHNGMEIEVPLRELDFAVNR